MAVQRGVHVTHREKTAICKLRRDPLGRNQPCWQPPVSLRASGIVRK